MIPAASDCEDVADFCKDVASDCNNPDFLQFYEDQCRKTCGFCGQRSQQKEEICEPMVPSMNAVSKCSSDKIGHMVECTVTCDAGYKMKVVKGAKDKVAIDDKSNTRVCLCEVGRCNWYGGAEVAFCVKQKTNECEDLERIDNSEVTCSNGYSHTSSCFTKCNEGFKFTSVYASNAGKTYPTQLRNICFCRNFACKWYGNTGLQCTAVNEMQAEWSEWSEWSTCSASCGRGQRYQVRECSEEGKCSGKPTKTEACQIKPCECSCAGASKTCRNRASAGYCRTQSWRCNLSRSIKSVCALTCKACKKPACDCA